ncbi:hypothetical protein [Hydrogenophaga sp. RWCD_12]|uniref:hypothetical protein n=1 Tax=Hydrogenophaga sp. RWCD_12 TaxID=3391190 RepID=UPI003984DFA2
MASEVTPVPTVGAVRHRTTVVAVLFVVGLLLAFFGWTRLEHRPQAPLDAVRTYLAQAAPATVTACQQPGAFEPYQTNGNRLRRLLQGREVDESAISIEFPDCLVRFYLRREGDGVWRVYRVHPHAG